MCVFLMDGLAGYAQCVCNGLPCPAVGSGIAHLQGLQALDQFAEGGDGPQAGGGIDGPGCVGKVLVVVHAVKLN
jgi:hypothetical protein